MPKSTGKRPFPWMRLVRRTHMYAGLLLFPWVLLYGATALLFNHPGALSPREVLHFDAEVLTSSALASPADPEDLALRVAAALKAKANEEGYDTSGWGEPTGARLTGKYQLRGGDEEHRVLVRIDPEGRGGTAYVGPADPESPLAGIEELKVDGLQVPESADDFADVPSKLELPVEKLRLQRGPTLVFDVPNGQETLRVQYELVQHELEVTDPAARGAVATGKSLLMDLHTTHVYPGVLGVRWLWSLFVDFMGLLMITWGVTGVMMWWQMKKLRRFGLIALAAGIGVMVVLATQLYGLYGY